MRWAGFGPEALSFSSSSALRGVFHVEWPCGLLPRPITHLAVVQRVVVPPHLWVDVVQVPLKALTLQTSPQCNPLRYVSVIDAVVLQQHRQSLCEINPEHL